jgi:putative toxin-antitoxin system antitoxin component (TIGR02293 family)
LPGRGRPRAFNYHDLEKARGCAAKKLPEPPAAEQIAQAARKTGLVIRMATAKARAKNVMAALLAKVRERIKGFQCPLPSMPFAPMLMGNWQGRAAMAKSTRVRKSGSGAPSADQWEQAGTPHGGFREAETAPGRFQLPPTSVDKLKTMGFTNDEIYRIVAPRRTLARRKELNQHLTTSESDRVLRLERISDMADRVFGDHEKAQRWLRKRSRVLDGIPIELLQSETGASLVEEELQRIAYGIFS